MQDLSVKKMVLSFRKEFAKYKYSNVSAFFGGQKDKRLAADKFVLHYTALKELDDLSRQEDLSVEQFVSLLTDIAQRSLDARLKIMVPMSSEVIFNPSDEELKQAMTNRYERDISDLEVAQTRDSQRKGQLYVSVYKERERPYNAGSFERYFITALEECGIKKYMSDSDKKLILHNVSNNHCFYVDNQLKVSFHHPEIHKDNSSSNFGAGLMLGMLL